MTSKANKHKSKSFIPPKPVPHIFLTQSGSKRWKKWKGCIYISSYEHTGEILMFLKDIKKNSSGLFLKNPVFVFISKEKAEVESQISEKIKSILRHNI